MYPQDRESGFYDFAEPTKQVVEFFSDYIGPYAYEKVANIQSPSVGGGIETAFMPGTNYIHKWGFKCIKEGAIGYSKNAEAQGSEINKKMYLFISIL